MDRRLAQAIKLLSTNLGRRLRLREVARAVGLGPRRLETLFKEGTGQTYVAYYRALRLQHAQRMLAASQKPVKEVAANLGYKHVEVFCRDFRLCFGQTPSEYARLRNKSVDFVIHQLNRLDWPEYRC